MFAIWLHITVIVQLSNGQFPRLQTSDRSEVWGLIGQERCDNWAYDSTMSRLEHKNNLQCLLVSFLLTMNCAVPMSCSCHEFRSPGCALELSCSWLSEEGWTMNLQNLQLRYVASSDQMNRTTWLVAWEGSSPKELEAHGSIHMPIWLVSALAKPRIELNADHVPCAVADASSVLFVMAQIA